MLEEDAGERKVSIYNQQVLEVSSKVEVVEDGEVELLGSIRYGLSTARMANDLRVAREESDAAFFNTHQKS